MRPLIPGTAYHAHVVVTLDHLQKVYDWSFTTRAADPRSSLTAKDGRLLFSSASRQPIRVSFTRAGGGRQRPVTIRPGHSVRLTLAPGSWQACGHQPAGGGYAAFDDCVTVTVTGVPAIKLGRPKVVHGQVDTRRPLQRDPARPHRHRDDHGAHPAVPRRHVRPGERRRADADGHPARPRR